MAKKKRKPNHELIRHHEPNEGRQVAALNMLLTEGEGIGMASRAQLELLEMNPKILTVSDEDELEVMFEEDGLIITLKGPMAKVAQALRQMKTPEENVLLDGIKGIGEGS